MSEDHGRALYRASNTKDPLNQFPEILDGKYGVNLGRLETRQQHVVPPWWTPPFICIAESAELAIKQHDAIDPGTMCIYTDGSSINGHVGAAAIAPVLQLAGINPKRTEYMGKSTTSTVYAAELKGLVLALQIILDIHIKVENPSKCIIFIDNQAAIQAIQNPRSQDAHLDSTS